MANQQLVEKGKGVVTSTGQHGELGVIKYHDDQVSGSHDCQVMFVEKSPVNVGEEVEFCVIRIPVGISGEVRIAHYLQPLSPEM